MRRKLIPILWFVGATAAVLWSCFWLFGVIDTGKFNPGILVLFGLGIFGAWGGFKVFREKKKRC